MVGKFHGLIRKHRLIGALFVWTRRKGSGGSEDYGV